MSYFDVAITIHQFLLVGAREQAAHNAAAARDGAREEIAAAAARATDGFTSRAASMRRELEGERHVLQAGTYTRPLSVEL